MAMEVIGMSLAGKIPCMFREMTGLYCPGCGGTRAVKALMQGRILQSVLYHPLVFYCVLAALIFLCSYLIYWKTKNPKFRLYPENGWIYIGLGILAVNVVVKNILLLQYDVDILAMLGNM